MSVPILLEKLDPMGITGDLEQSLFNDYLGTRNQTVCVDNHNSCPLPVEFGVPQGSILGPLVFLIYINDLPKVLTKCEVVLYADDTALFVHRQRFA